jgi:cation-transporting P-type ATPase F
VVLVNAVVGLLQEYRAAKAISALARSMVATATVRRGGQTLRVPSPELVPGDVVLLASGDQVPADLRLVRVRDLQVSEAALTGESVPVQKGVAELPPETPLADRKNLAFATGLVTYGQATGVVVATGDRTEVGKIQRLIQTAEDLSTPLTREIARFSMWLMYVILAIAAFTFVVGLLHRQAPEDTVPCDGGPGGRDAIPEGLPAAVTVVLAIGVRRMAARHAIIRKLPAVEALGSTAVICSDKTGTLTENQMTVQRVWAGGGCSRCPAPGTPRTGRSPPKTAGAG